MVGFPFGDAGKSESLIWMNFFLSALKYICVSLSSSLHGLSGSLFHISFDQK